MTGFIILYLTSHLAGCLFLPSNLGSVLLFGVFSWRVALTFLYLKFSPGSLCFLVIPSHHFSSLLTEHLLSPKRHTFSIIKTLVWLLAQTVSHRSWFVMITCPDSFRSPRALLIPPAADRQAGVLNGPRCFNCFLTVYEWEPNCELNEQVGLGNYCNLTPHPPTPSYKHTASDTLTGDHTEPERNSGTAGVCRSKRKARGKDRNCREKQKNEEQD